MKKRSEIKDKMKELRGSRDYAKRFDNTKGYVYLNNGAIWALEWVLGYKCKSRYWCFRCAILHNDLKCPRCGNDKVSSLGGKE